MKYYSQIIFAAFLALAFVFLLHLSSCVTAPVPSPIPSTENGTWQDIVASSFVGQSLLSVCPNWNTDKVNKALVWQKFWRNIVQYESGGNPNSTYTETGLGIDPQTGKQVVSAGLFQLSFQDSQNYKGDCLAISYSPNPRNIFDPLLNSKCAMLIADHLLSNHRPLSSYWSTSREGSNSMNNFKKISPECF